VGDLRSALSVLAAGLVLLGFATPLRVLWSGPHFPWWAPFAIWAAAIVALALAGRGGDGRSGP
jgi:uncharacterized protein (DUF983 family)